ncbi:hypothetical protein NBRC116596_21370 [Litorivita sp. NS0012-18]
MSGLGGRRSSRSGARRRRPFWRAVWRAGAGGARLWADCNERAPMPAILMLAHLAISRAQIAVRLTLKRGETLRDRLF